MKVYNMESVKGNKIANQFIISDHNGTGRLTFQSYNSIIAIKENGRVTLDETYWGYSSITSKYRNIFLGEDRKETEKKIKSGEYILTNLN